MSEHIQTKLRVTNPLRSAAKVRRLTPEELDIPTGKAREQDEPTRWERLHQAANEAAPDGDVGVAVRTDEGNISTGILINRGRSHTVHALELAVWKAYSESGSPITEIAIAASEPDYMPCGRCLQVAADYAENEQMIQIARSDGETIGEYSLDKLL